MADPTPAEFYERAVNDMRKTIIDLGWEIRDELSSMTLHNFQIDDFFYIQVEWDQPNFCGVVICIHTKEFYWKQWDENSANKLLEFIRDDQSDGHTEIHNH